MPPDPLIGKACFVPVYMLVPCMATIMYYAPELLTLTYYCGPLTIYHLPTRDVRLSRYFRISRYLFNIEIKIIGFIIEILVNFGILLCTTLNM